MQIYNKLIFINTIKDFLLNLIHSFCMILNSNPMRHRIGIPKLLNLLYLKFGMSKLLVVKFSGVRVINTWQYVFFKPIFVYFFKKS